MKTTIKQLQVFVYTAKFGSISQAAEACFITQAAASLSLANLETMLDTQLFDRIGRRIILNSKGQELLPSAQAIIDRLQEFEERAQGEVATLTGSIKIAASTTIANYVLPKYIAAFKTQYPQVNFDIQIANTQEVIDLIDNLSIDYGFIEGFCSGSHIQQEKWLDDAICIIGSTNCALAQQAVIYKQDLLQAQWVEREAGSGTKDVVSSLLQHPLHVVATLPSSEAIINYVAHSDVLGYLSQTIINNGGIPKNITAIPVKDISLTRNFNRVLHRSKHQTQQGQAFWEFIQTI